LSVILSELVQTCALTAPMMRRRNFPEREQRAQEGRPVLALTRGDAAFPATRIETRKAWVDSEVECGRGFIEHDDVRLENQRPGGHHTPAMTARQRSRFAGRQMLTDADLERA
jgi:hypothetical protein